LGNTYLELGEYKKASESYQKLLDNNPEDEDGLINMGVVHSRLGEYSKSIEFYSKLIDIKEAKGVTPPRLVMKNLALSYESLGELKKSAESYQKIIYLWPGDAEAHYDLGMIYKKMGEDKNAEDAFTKALEFDPEKYESKIRNEGLSPEEILGRQMLKNFKTRE
jgi:tetratricopeptide (TPR) repeat protein